MSDIKQCMLEVLQESLMESHQNISNPRAISLEMYDSTLVWIDMPQRIMPTDFTLNTKRRRQGTINPYFYCVSKYPSFFIDMQV